MSEVLATFRGPNFVVQFKAIPPKDAKAPAPRTTWQCTASRALDKRASTTSTQRRCRTRNTELVAASTALRAGEYLRVVTGEVERGAGVEANLGKTRVYNAAGGDAPPGIAALGPDVWCGDLPPARRGFVALGVPIGHPDFVGAHAAGRLEAEADLLHKLQRLPDLQSAWLLLELRGLRPAFS